MKKFVSIILMLCLLLSCSALAEITAPGEFPVATEGETLQVWASSFSNMTDFPNLPHTKWFEEKTGVHIDWIEVPNADMTAIFNTSIAGDDKPDIYMSYRGDLLTFAEDEVIIPLDELIDTYSVYLKGFLDANPDIRAEITAPDGHIWAIPKVESNVYQSTANKMWVYTEWLDAYKAATGNGDPQTIDEFEEMLLYFKANDMNGNGDPDDEIVITGNANYGAAGGDPLAYIMNAFLYLPYDVGGPNYFYVEDGKVKSDVMSDDMREGLKYANKLYNEGLIISEAFTQSLVDMRAVTTTTKDHVVVACIPAPYHFRMLTAQSIENAVGFSDYTALTPLDNYKTGEKVVPARPIDGIGNRCIVTKACEERGRAELAIRWLDTFFTEEVIEDMVFRGIRDNGDWEFVDGVTSLGGDNRAVVNHLSADEQNRTWNRDWIGSTWLTLETRYMTAADGDALHEEEAGKLYRQYARQAGWPRMIWSTDVDLNADKSTLQSLIVGDITTAMSEFTMGIRDINDDAAWEAYKAQLEADGYEKFIDICNQYYGFE